MTFSNDPTVVAPIRSMMLDVARGGGELHDAARPRAHHGERITTTARARGLTTPARRTGRRRTTTAPTRSASGSTARRRAATRSRSTSPPVRDLFAERRQCPDSLLLWFHHVRLDEAHEIGTHAVGGAGAPLPRGRRLRPLDAPRRGIRVEGLDRQRALRRRRELPRDPGAGGACGGATRRSQYFQTFSRLPIPSDLEQPAHPLAFYRALRCPPDRTSRVDDSSTACHGA